MPIKAHDATLSTTQEMATLSPTQDVVSALHHRIGAWGTNVGKVARALESTSPSYAAAIAPAATETAAATATTAAATAAAATAEAAAATAAAAAEAAATATAAATAEAAAATAADATTTDDSADATRGIKRYATFEMISMTPSTVFKLKFMRKPLTLPTAEANGKRYVMALPLVEALLETAERKIANRFISRLSPATGTALQDFVKRGKLHEEEDDILMVRSDGLWSFLVSIMPSHKNVSKKMRTELFDMVMEQITCDTTEPKKRKACGLPEAGEATKRRIAGEAGAIEELAMHEAIFNARAKLNLQRKETIKDLQREEEVRAAARTSRLADLREELRIRTALAAVGDSAVF